MCPIDLSFPSDNSFITNNYTSDSNNYYTNSNYYTDNNYHTDYQNYTNNNDYIASEDGYPMDTTDSNSSNNMEHDDTEREYYIDLELLYSYQKHPSTYANIIDHRS